MEQDLKDLEGAQSKASGEKENGSETTEQDLVSRTSYLKVLSEKKNKDKALKEALSVGIDKDSSYISKAKNNERRILYQKHVNSQFTNSIITDSLSKYSLIFSVAFSLTICLK